MICFPNAKINLGLNVLRKREDEYHDIASLLYPIPWHDVLEIVKADRFAFHQSGLSIDGSVDTNLCVKAYHLLKEDMDIGPVEIHLHKAIPMGAGLGGGSSNGAFTLKLLNHIFELNLTPDQLKDYASQLGSDCPFFIDNIPAMATNTGTELEPFSVDLSEKYLTVIKPDVHVSTKEAYAGVTPNQDRTPLNELLLNPIEKWQETIYNDFESSIYPIHPELRKIKESLISMGAVYASMTGSGAAVYGIFENEITLGDRFRNSSVLQTRLKMDQI
jgi:4-diphosphocytidyl-2-C-methyl-D-erythritol kinase